MIERIKKGTVIITGGRIYALFHELNPTSNEVCEKCELREECESGMEIHKFVDLCLANDVPGDGYFLECFPTTKKTIREIALGQNLLETFASEDDATVEL